MTRTQRPRVLILVPNPRRDLEGHARVAYFLERLGCRTRLCKLEAMGDLVVSDAPHAVVLDYIDDGLRLRVARVARALGIRTVILTTAGLYQGEDEELRGQLRSPEVCSLIDCYLAWGDRVRDILVARELLPPERIHAVGSPRFDDYSPPWLATVSERAALLQRIGVSRPDAPVITWTTNTYFAEARYWEAVPPTPLDVAVLNDSRTVYEELSQLTLTLAARRPEYTFLIKLHPSEWAEPYQRLAASAPNIHLVIDAPVRDVLYHSAVVLQRWSTTGTEAWLLGRPVLECAIGNYGTALRDDYVAGMHVVESSNEALAAVDDYVRGADVPEPMREAREQFIRYTYHAADGQSSARSAAQIHALLASGPPPDDTHLRAELSRRREAIGVTSAMRRLRGQLHEWLARSGAAVMRRLRHSGDGTPVRPGWTEPVSDERKVWYFRRFARLERDGQDTPTAAVGAPSA